jgi:hypothetical protein
MNTHDTSLTQGARIQKADHSAPALIVTGLTSVSIRAGTVFGGHVFEAETPVTAIELEPGRDYAVVIDPDSGKPRIEDLTAVTADPAVLGGFHFAPGGNATARAGGDDVPQINPCSLWDVAFRPACPDPRGMALVEMKDGRRFWCDIYLTGADHLANGTSSFGATIADGDSLPQKPAGKGRFKRFDYEAACEVMAHHGKGLLSFEEFAVAAFGVAEKTAHDGNPETTQCDPARTSKFGLMQATGNMWVWGHDGDPDLPRASIFGGSWFNDDNAGSRYAYVASYWPGNSLGIFGARGRGDHLQLD